MILQIGSLENQICHYNLLSLCQWQFVLEKCFIYILFCLVTSPSLMLIPAPFGFDFISNLVQIRGGSRAAATSKMECFVIIVNGWKP